MVGCVFNTTAVLSLLLCAAAVILWVRGRSPRDDHLQIAVNGHFFDLFIFGSNLSLDVVNRWPGKRGVWITCCRQDDELNGAGPERYGFLGNHVVDWQWFGINIQSGILVPFCDDNGVPVRGGGQIPSDGPVLPFWGVHEVPFGLIVAFMSVAPLGWLVTFLVRRSRRASRDVLRLCSTCGYDLRASQDRCPECGTPIIQVEPAKPDARQIHI